MSDWAQREAAKTLERDRARDQETEKANREARIKAETGPQLFKQLHDWVVQRVAEYNQHLGRKDLVVTMHKAPRPQPDFFFDSITVSRNDGKQSPLKINYSLSAGILSCECGAGKFNFHLIVTGDGQAQFETPNHQMKSIEEIGEEMLSKFMDSQF